MLSDSVRWGPLDGGDVGSMSDDLLHKTNGSFETQQLTANCSVLQHESRGHEPSRDTGEIWRDGRLSLRSRQVPSRIAGRIARMEMASAPSTRDSARTGLGNLRPGERVRHNQMNGQSASHPRYRWEHSAPQIVLKAAKATRLGVYSQRILAADDGNPGV